MMPVYSTAGCQIGSHHATVTSIVTPTAFVTMVSIVGVNVTLTATATGCRHRGYAPETLFEFGFSSFFRQKIRRQSKGHALGVGGGVKRFPMNIPTPSGCLTGFGVIFNRAFGVFTGLGL